MEPPPVRTRSIRDASWAPPSFCPRSAARLRSCSAPEGSNSNGRGARTNSLGGLTVVYTFQAPKQRTPSNDNIPLPAQMHLPSALLLALTALSAVQARRAGAMSPQTSLQDRRHAREMVQSRQTSSREVVRRSKRTPKQRRSVGHHSLAQFACVREHVLTMAVLMWGIAGLLPVCVQMWAGSRARSR